jgi:hypothetical protein
MSRSNYKLCNRKPSRAKRDGRGEGVLHSSKTPREAYPLTAIVEIYESPAGSHKLHPKLHPYQHEVDRDAPRAWHVGGQGGGRRLAVGAPLLPVLLALLPPANPDGWSPNKPVSTAAPPPGKRASHASQVVQGACHLPVTRLLCHLCAAPLTCSAPLPCRRCDTEG